MSNRIIQNTQSIIGAFFGLMLISSAFAAELPPIRVCREINANGNLIQNGGLEVHISPSHQRMPLALYEANIYVMNNRALPRQVGNTFQVTGNPGATQETYSAPNFNLTIFPDHDGRLNLFRDASRAVRCVAVSH